MINWSENKITPKPFFFHKKLLFREKKRFGKTFGKQFDDSHTTQEV